MRIRQKIVFLNTIHHTKSCISTYIQHMYMKLNISALVNPVQYQSRVTVMIKY